MRYLSHGPRSFCPLHRAFTRRVAEGEEKDGVMEMRAEDEICMGQNVTPDILPIAFCLSETFLLTHCSACFFPLENPPQNPFLACDSHPSYPLRYCSRPFRDADADCHRLSGECHLTRSPLTPDAVSDIRTALRLLLFVERLGFLHLDRRRKIEGDEEVLARIREGRREGDCGCAADERWWLFWFGGGERGGGGGVVHCSNERRGGPG